MTTFSKQLKLSTAVFAAAAVLITPSVAFADTEGDAGSDTESASVGTSAAKTPKRAGRGANKPSTTSSGSSATASSPASDGPAAPAAEVADAPDIPEVGAGPSADATADATAFDNPLFQNPLIWIGTPNPNPPTPIAEFETFPLEDVSEPLRGAFGWMQDFEFEACVLGLSSVTRGQNVVGPYGTATTSVSGGGCA